MVLLAKRQKRKWVGQKEGRIKGPGVKLEKAVYFILKEEGKTGSKVLGSTKQAGTATTALTGWAHKNRA